jgi:hypothetical protein
MTAKEFLDKQEGYANLKEMYPKLNESIQEVMIDFAKFHVKMALEEVNFICENEIEKDFINEDLIINAYPLHYIK